MYVFEKRTCHFVISYWIYNHYIREVKHAKLDGWTKSWHNIVSVLIISVEDKNTRKKGFREKVMSEIEITTPTRNLSSKAVIAARDSALQVLCFWALAYTDAGVLKY